MRHEDLELIVNAPADIDYLLGIIEAMQTAQVEAKRDADYWQERAQKGAPITDDALLASVIESLGGEYFVDDDLRAHAATLKVTLLRDHDREGITITTAPEIAGASA